jgi:Mg/Co/Ni transporter MgtE
MRSTNTYSQRASRVFKGLWVGLFIGLILFVLCVVGGFILALSGTSLSLPGLQVQGGPDSPAVSFSGWLAVALAAAGAAIGALVAGMTRTRAVRPPSSQG